MFDVIFNNIYTPCKEYRMFCHKTTNLKMQKINHKSLKVIYQSDASYDNLLQLSNSVSLHQRHLRFLLTEIYKSTGTLNPQFMWWYFKCREVSHKLRRGPVLFISTARSTIYGTNLCTMVLNLE